MRNCVVPAGGGESTPDLIGLGVGLESLGCSSGESISAAAAPGYNCDRSQDGNRARQLSSNTMRAGGTQTAATLTMISTVVSVFMLCHSSEVVFVDRRRAAYSVIVIAISASAWSSLSVAFLKGRRQRCTHNAEIETKHPTAICVTVSGMTNVIMPTKISFRINS